MAHQHHLHFHCSASLVGMIYCFLKQLFFGGGGRTRDWIQALVHTRSAFSFWSPPQVLDTIYFYSSNEMGASRAGDITQWSLASPAQSHGLNLVYVRKHAHREQERNWLTEGRIEVWSLRNLNLPKASHWRTTTRWLFEAVFVSGSQPLDSCTPWSKCQVLSYVWGWHI